MPPTTPTAGQGPRDVTQNCSVEQLLEVRQRALDIAASRTPPRQPQESDASRRVRVTADAAAYVEFLLAGKIHGQSLQ